MRCVLPAFGVPNRQMCACHVNRFGVFFSCVWSREWVNSFIKPISLAYVLAALCCCWCAELDWVTPAVRVGVFDRHTCLWISSRVKETATPKQNCATARDMLNMQLSACLFWWPSATGDPPTVATSRPLAAHSTCYYPRLQPLPSPWVPSPSWNLDSSAPLGRGLGKTK